MAQSAIRFKSCKGGCMLGPCERNSNSSPGMVNCQPGCGEYEEGSDFARSNCLVFVHYAH